MMCVIIESRAGLCIVPEEPTEMGISSPGKEDAMDDVTGQQRLRFSALKNMVDGFLPHPRLSFLCALQGTGQRPWA